MCYFSFCAQWSTNSSTHHVYCCTQINSLPASAKDDTLKQSRAFQILCVCECSCLRQKDIDAQHAQMMEYFGPACTPDTDQDYVKQLMADKWQPVDWSCIGSAQQALEQHRQDQQHQQQLMRAPPPPDLKYSPCCLMCCLAKTCASVVTHLQLGWHCIYC